MPVGKRRRSTTTAAGRQAGRLCSGKGGRLSALTASSSLTNVVMMQSCGLMLCCDAAPRPRSRSDLEACFAMKRRRRQVIWPVWSSPMWSTGMRGGYIRRPRMPQELMQRHRYLLSVFGCHLNIAPSSVGSITCHHQHHQMHLILALHRGFCRSSHDSLAGQHSSPL